VNATCHGLNNGTACADATGATAPISYLWSTGDTTQCVDSLAPGTYIVAITDANGCAGSDTIVITEPELLAIAGDVLVYPNGYNVSVINGSDGAIDISVTGGSGVYTYVWTIVNDSTAEDQLNLVADTYVVVVTDANGCTVTAEYILEQPPIIELPTGFSPGNFDGMNDYYVIHGIDGLIDNKFTVFNRWGQVIYEKEGYHNDWAGTNQNGNMMPDGTYFILFTVKVPGQGELTFKATVEQRQNLGK
jgi:gliding motility-associated-like protein